MDGLIAKGNSKEAAQLEAFLAKVKFIYPQCKLAYSPPFYIKMALLGPPRSPDRAGPLSPRIWMGMKNRVMQRKPKEGIF